MCVVAMFVLDTYMYMIVFAAKCIIEATITIVCSFNTISVYYCQYE